MDRLYSFLLPVALGLTTQYFIKWLDGFIDSEN